MKRRILRLLRAFGCDPVKFFRSVCRLRCFLSDKARLKKQAKNATEKFPFGNDYPILDEGSSGGAKGHYFHQDLHVARRIFENNPNIHIDVGSRVDGFIAHVAVFRKIKVVDIRPQTSVVKNIEFIQADMMIPVSDELIECCDSLSCLHALEHFGLGRYGDPIDFEGHLKGLENLYKMLKAGGKLYLSVPIGKQRIEFNGQRVFDVQTLLNYFRGRYHLDCFSYVDSCGDFHENVDLTSQEEIERDFGCTCGCGIFELTKRVSGN